MITGNGFIIATPTKCATTTIEAVARRHMRSGANADLFRIMDWDSPRRQHRMALPSQRDGDPDWGSVTRYLFTRNPYRRYMSIYTYLSAPANYSQWGARAIQGREWGGHDESKIINKPKMTFEQFLYWMVDQRTYDADCDDRPDFKTGAAYKSPWVWIDSLATSRRLLRDQPGQGRLKVRRLQMENLWGDLARLERKHGWGGRVDLSPTIHANRSTGYGEDGPDPSSPQFWGGIRHGRRVFDGRTFNPHRVTEVPGCDCAGCLIGVASEAHILGYV